MLDHFSVSMRNLKALRVWTLVTSAFSQESIMHLFVNCLTLYFIGPHILAAVGARRFLNIYLVGGLFSSVAHVTYQNFLLPYQDRQRYYKPRRYSLSCSVPFGTMPHFCPSSMIHCCVCVQKLRRSSIRRLRFNQQHSRSVRWPQPQRIHDCVPHPRACACPRVSGLVFGVGFLFGFQCTR